MNVKLLSLILVFFYFGNVTAQVLTSQENNSTTSTTGLKVFDFNELESYLNSKKDGNTYVINFWATWCAPCVKELPYFEALNTNYKNKNVEVVLVSLDFPKQIETKLVPFLKKRGFRSEVVILNDVDSNTWIPKVNKDWSGAIPATLIYNKNRGAFYERSFNYLELETELKQFIK
ncbi:TlpA family protein disulfide reductase [Psychroserpens burtonensis]|uniref:TlpA family protein disulfide reductase n=1 Tax=Psychroserpens burtonensis TaxID=49278 RepID=A0A5C7B8L5_9FLAO|nr:TlpA disulfide reductase family protein [Psychroserpens burtonensis]TXE16703.1 TlpA family protein disulfide reductase [Psychroserpens burtonensis]